MSRSAVFAVALVAVAVAAVSALPTDNATAPANKVASAAGPASLDVAPLPGHIMVRPPPRQVEEASAAPVSLPVRPANLGPGPALPPGTVKFPSEQPLQQADERLDADQQDVWSWDNLRDGCGDTKNCLGFPENCESDSSAQCTAIVTVQVLPQDEPTAPGGKSDMFTFRMRASDAKWVAVGLGETSKMHDTSVIECVANPDGTIETYLSYTPQANERKDCIRMTNPGGAIKLRQSRYMDAGLFCEVSRVNQSRLINIDWNLDEKPFFLQLALGTKFKNIGGIGGLMQHNKGAVSAASSVRLDAYRTLGAASNWPMRLHGALMVLAWMFAATAGSLAARYFKAAWGKATICGKAMWFAWHRLLMILTVVLHVVAIIAALIYLEGWSSSSGVHGILGGVTTALALLQGAAGLLRPSPDHKYRPLFNWGHRVQGFATHVIAIVTIFFAVGLPYARLPSYTYAILGVYVLFYFILHGVHSLTEVKSYYFIFVLFGSAAFAITMLILVVIGPA